MQRATYQGSQDEPVFDFDGAEKFCPDIEAQANGHHRNEGQGNRTGDDGVRPVLHGDGRTGSSCRGRHGDRRIYLGRCCPVGTVEDVWPNAGCKRRSGKQREDP